MEEAAAGGSSRHGRWLVVAPLLRNAQGLARSLQHSLGVLWPLRRGRGEERHCPNHPRRSCRRRALCRRDPDSFQTAFRISKHLSGSPDKAPASCKYFFARLLASRSAVGPVFLPTDPTWNFHNPTHVPIFSLPPRSPPQNLSYHTIREHGVSGSAFRAVHPPFHMQHLPGCFPIRRSAAGAHAD